VIEESRRTVMLSSPDPVYSGSVRSEISCSSWPSDSASLPSCACARFSEPPVGVSVSGSPMSRIKPIGPAGATQPTD